MFIMRLAIWFLVILDFPDISRVVAVPTCISIFSFEYVNVFGVVVLYGGYAWNTFAPCCRRGTPCPESTLMMLFSSNFGLFMQSSVCRGLFTR